MERLTDNICRDPRCCITVTHYEGERQNCVHRLSPPSKPVCPKCGARTVRLHSARPYCRCTNPDCAADLFFPDQPTPEGGEPCATTPCQSSAETTNNTLLYVNATPAVASNAPADVPPVGEGQDCPSCGHWIYNGDHCSKCGYDKEAIAERDQMTKERDEARAKLSKKRAFHKAFVEINEEEILHLKANESELRIRLEQLNAAIDQNRVLSDENGQLRARHDALSDTMQRISDIASSAGSESEFDGLQLCLTRICLLSNGGLTEIQQLRAKVAEAEKATAEERDIGDQLASALMGKSPEEHALNKYAEALDDPSEVRRYLADQARAQKPA